MSPQADQTYPFIVGGDPGVDATPDRGIQRIDVQIAAGGGGHYVRVRFSSNTLGNITRTAYCRGSDNPRIGYTHLSIMATGS
jgi:hypothetical protein